MPEKWMRRSIESVEFLSCGKDPHPLRIQRRGIGDHKYYKFDRAGTKLLLQGLKDLVNGFYDKVYVLCGATNRTILFKKEHGRILLVDKSMVVWGWDVNNVKNVMIPFIKEETLVDYSKPEKEKDMTNTWRIQFISKPSVVQVQAGAKAKIICELSAIGDDAPTATAEAVLENFAKFKEFMASGMALEVKPCPFGEKA